MIIRSPYELDRERVLAYRAVVQDLASPVREAVDRDGVLPLAFGEGLELQFGAAVVEGHVARFVEHVTGCPCSRITTSRKSSSASTPGRCTCGTNALTGARTTSMGISGRLAAT